MPIFLHQTEFERLAESELAAWRGAATSLISDAMAKAGTLAATIRPRTDACNFAGQALTIRVVPAGNNPVVHGIDVAQANDVVVIDAGGHENNAVSGGHTGRLYQQRGVVAMIIDGAIRDLEEIRTSGLPTFSKAVTPAGPHKDNVGDINGAVTCGGVMVRPGDLVVGDHDGVVIVPLGKRHAVWQAYETARDSEEEWLKKLADGSSFAQAVGMAPVVLAK